MNGKVTEWLERYAPGFSELSTQEREAITTFSLLWSLFESKRLNEVANAKAILALCQTWADRGYSPPKNFGNVLGYYQRRYSDNGELNWRFDHLHLRKNDQPQLVQDVIRGQEGEPWRQFAASLIVAYRYRNNYFHGLKWAYEFRDQLGNFQTSNQLLIMALELPEVENEAA